MKVQWESWNREESKSQWDNKVGKHSIKLANQLLNQLYR
jgi:hypothetical protein